METIYEKLFYSYGESVLHQLEDYDEGEILGRLEELALDTNTVLRLEDLFFECYGRWSAGAFALGLHLGLSLFHGHVGRDRAQQVHEVPGG